MPSMLRTCAVAAIVGAFAVNTATAAEPPPAAPLRLSLAEAVQLALGQSYAIRLAEVDRETAEQDIRAAYSILYPRIDANASYQRTLATPNPFAGSAAGDLFSGFSAGDWTTFNERIRRSDPTLDTAAIGNACPAAVAAGALQQVSFTDFFLCQSAASTAIRQGDPPSPDANPFLVENTFRAGLAGSQLLFSGSAFAALRGAEAQRNATSGDFKRTAQQVVELTTQAYYGVRLAQASVEVLEKSVARTRDTVREVKTRQKEGVVPQFQVLSAEVELANLETELLTARNRARVAENNFAFNLGIPANTQVVLTDSLEFDLQTIPVEVEAVAQAVASRPDVYAAEQRIELSKAIADDTFSRYLPELRLVANLTIVGNVPDNLERVGAVPPADGLILSGNPFAFESEQRGFFDDSFWGTNFTAGLNLTWNLFEGFATAAQHSRDKLATQRARIQLERLKSQIEREVVQLSGDVRSSLERVQLQSKNIERAELNYRHAELRVKEGVTSQLELREASNQLDQSRFNQLQAIHDYLVANISFQVALGQAPFARDEDTE